MKNKMNTLNKMKSVIILTAVLVTGALFTSCSSDDDAPSEPSIVGEWLQTSETSETFIDGESQGKEELTVDENNFVRVTFNADGTFSEFYSEEFNGMVETSTEPGTYTISGNILTVNYGSETDTFENEFTITGDQLVIVFTDVDEANNTGYVSTTTFVRQ